MLASPEQCINYQAWGFTTGDAPESWGLLRKYPGDSKALSYWEVFLSFELNSSSFTGRKFYLSLEAIIITITRYPR